MNNDQLNEDTRSGAIAFMARNRLITNLLMAVLIGGGIWTMLNIQKEVFPEFALDFVEVNVNYPGAAPTEVEQGIILPVEEAIKGIQGIREITSQANEGSGNISVELVPGTNRMKALQDIDQAVSRIQTFPDDIEQPQVTLRDRVMDVMQIGLFGNVDVWTLRQLAEQLRNILLSNDQITR